MADSILEVKNAESPQKVIPSLLPCKIQHNGSVEPSASFWAPTRSADGKPTAYFRGRKLQGREIAVPEGYKGVIALKRKAPEKHVPLPDEPIDVDAEEESLPLGSLEEIARFEKVVVWGHESVADATDNVYVRGVEEWIGLSEKIHTFDYGQR